MPSDPLPPGFQEVLRKVRGGVPELTGKQLASGRWLRAYARWMLTSMDAALFVCSGLIVGLFAEFFKQVEGEGEPTLLALTAIGFAALAVALTALAIFVSLVNDEYLAVLAMSKDGGLSGHLVPFLAAAFISSVATIFGAVAGLVYKAISADWGKAALLGLEVGFVVWATWAVFQIVVEVAVHGLNRYDMAGKFEAAKNPDLSDIFDDDTPPHRSAS